MKLFSADLTLYEMEQRLEHCFLGNDRKIRIIGDLNLSSEDYKYLNFKLKGILHYISRVEVMEQYRFSILTTLVFAIRYEKNVMATLKYYEQYMIQFQQHQYRFCMRMLADTFHEMALSTYGIKIHAYQELIEVLTIHASLLKNTYEEVFEILDDHFSQSQNYILDDELYGKLDRVFLRAYPFLNVGQRNFHLGYLLKDLYEACYLGHKPLEQLYDDFDTLSKQLIEDCYSWFKAYSINSNNLIKIR